MATDCFSKRTIQLKDAIENGDRLLTHIHVPCGKCARCLTRRKMEWGFRMEEEMSISKTTYFVTLTYNPENVPYNQYGLKTLVETRAEDLKYKAKEHGRKRITKKFKSLHIDRSLQGFFKRLRQNHTRVKSSLEHQLHNLNQQDKIKYYACGEYGEQNTKRPHYHAIIFNTSQIAITKSWTLGEVHILPATKETIAYVMKYLDKRIGITEEDSWKRKKEFNTMSEGIGLSYLKNSTWHKRNLDVLYVKNMSGHMIPMAKYYRDKIFTDEEKKEQVLLVTERLEEIQNEKIVKVGLDHYNYIQRVQPIEDERRFRKKMKKRIVE